MQTTDWHKCYGQSWQGIITPEAFSHPAKFSRALIRRIYRHAIDEGWLSPGDTVVDPFGGVALGALHAMQHGLHWVGVELEERFVDLGRENIAKWTGEYQAHFPGWGTAQLHQGDSRELAQVVLEAGAVVGSPPYTGDALGHSRGKATDAEREMGSPDVAYGSAPGQLAALPEGDLSACISSPPYAKGCQHTGGNDPHPEHITGGEYHGVGISAAISSPPYTASLASDDPDKRGGLFRDPKQRDDKTLTAEYGATAGQLGAMAEGAFDAAVSSPPFLGSGIGGKDNVVGRNRQCVTRNRPPEVEKLGNLRGLTYGEQPGQLAKMPEGEFAQGVVSNPPFEDQNPCHDPNYKERRKKQGGPLHGEYGTAAGQLGQESGPTFWSASRVIVDQVYQVLRPGGVAIWVTKSFVCKGERVNFPGQWRELCEAAGFEPLHEHRAWLVEERGAQYTLDGELEERTVTRKSFFRRLAEQKGSPSIDWETVLCMRKR